MGNNIDMAQFAQAITQFAQMFSQTQNAQTVSQENKPIENVKRGRGRPPKKQTQENKPIENVKRGRGRPPKGAVITTVTTHKVKDSKVLSSQELEIEKMRGVVNAASERAQEKIAASEGDKKTITKVLFTACVKKEYKDKLRNMKVIALGNAYFSYDARRQMIGAPISEKAMARYYKLRHNSEIEIDAKFAKILVVE